MKSLCASILLLAACGSKPTSPAGAIGKTYDGRAALGSAASKAPTDDKAISHELVVDAHGAKAKIVWRTFADGANHYIVSYNWEVVTPKDAITLEPAGNVSPVNSGSTDAVDEMEIVLLGWKDNAVAGTSLGQISVQIDGAGSGKLL
jgi:hypothetical protein